MSYTSFTAPNCTIDIYPYEGGSFQLTSITGLLRACRVNRTVTGNPATFEMLLAPGGPYGVNVSPQWTSIIRPMSLVVIAFERAGRANVAMVGLVRSIWESEEWQTGQTVQREVHVVGADFAHIFNQANFFAALFMYSQAALQGADNAVGTIMELGLQNVSLSTAANAWFNKVMAGQKGLLSNMNFAYGEARPSFTDLMAVQFTDYPNLGLTIPTAQNFAVMSGTWMALFQNLFQSPWFECFVTTAEEGDYGQPLGTQPIESTNVRCAPVSPSLIARPTPIPVLTDPSGPSGYDSSLWDALPVVTLDTLGPLARNSEWDDTGVYNFYAINPTYIGTLFGGGNAQNIAFVQQFGAWIDSASIERYGYRPFIANPPWFADPTGDYSRQVQNQGGLDQLMKVVGTINLKACSYYEPLPLMVSGRIVTNLRPDIMPGTRLQYGMSRNLDPWLFYINTVEHSFVFGGQTTTTLTLARGLPLSVYSDQSMMTALLTGNAMLQDGAYQIGLPQGAGKPLSVLNFNSVNSGLVSQIAGIYATPGKQ